MANAAYAEWADQAATKYGVPTDLFRSLVETESGWNPAAISSKGAYGLAQLMPGTAQDLGVNRYDVKQNLDGGARYLAEQFKTFGNWKDALAAYNAGPGNIQAGQGYAEKVLSGANMTNEATAETGGSWLHDLLYGKGTPRLGMEEGTGQITDGQGNVINAPASVSEFFERLFTWEFWQPIFANSLAVVAVIALIAFGVYSLLNQAKALAK